MIIQSINAENFRRYELLTIENIPESGLITVDGDNEAGKSTISDALCFSLFGRTFLIEQDNVHKLVNWDADYCATTIQFRKSGTHYSLTRTCDKTGLIAAQLLDADDNIIADEVNDVDQCLLDIIGYGYDTFADSFYLMQRELTTPTSDSIKNMVGINHYSKLIEEFDDESNQDRQELDFLRPKFENLFQEIEEIGLDETWLPELVETRESLETVNLDKQKYSRLLSQLRTEYPDDQPQYQKYLSRFTFFNTLANSLLPLTVIIWLTWAIAEFFPQFLESLPFTEHPLFKSSLVTGGLMVIVIYASSLFYSWWLDSKIISPLKKKSNECKQILEGVLVQIEQAEVDIPERVNAMLVSIAEKPKLLPTSSISDINNTHFVQDICLYNSKVDETDSICESLEHSLTHQRDHISQHQSVLHDAIEAEMARTDEAGKLRKERNQVEKSIKNHSRNIKVNDQAIQLLKVSAKQFSEQFNAIITENSSRILPHFTNGRYKQIKIDDTIQVKIFSNEKDDFIDFNEVSSGTQRQIMLSLRFAMSEQLAINTDNQHQFILLDEPFAFFDHARTVETLTTLPTASDIVNQIWVFSQEFPTEITPKKIIHCEVNNTQLSV